MDILFLLLLYLLSINAENSVCPSECTCDMRNGLRSARCNGEKLTTVEVNIPSEVQYVDYSDNYISVLNDYIFTVRYT